MSKHPRSPEPDLPSKRRHALFAAHSRPEPSKSPIDTLYDELLLHIFSYLDAVDLCATQATCKPWSRLASDNHIWKKLYLAVYGRTRLQGSKGFVSRNDGRTVKELPQRAKSKIPIDLQDWKWMFRISTNWKRGLYLFMPVVHL
jgi:hypothetical protein